MHIVTGVAAKRIFPESRIDDELEYVVVGVPKDRDGGPRIAFRGSYDDSAAYAERNESEDNYETYYVAEVVLCDCGADKLGPDSRERHGINLHSPACPIGVWERKHDRVLS
jgi:hypothetical protein